MKTKFNKNWKSSKQPRKQRKYLANAPLHIKKKFAGVNLSKDLRKKYGKRNIPLRKGDVVKIMRGKFKKKRGKVLKVETKKSKITIEGIQIKKIDGSKVDVKLHPSNLQIIELNLDDKERNRSLEKKEKPKTENKKEIKEAKKVKIKKTSKEEPK